MKRQVCLYLAVFSLIFFMCPAEAGAQLFLPQEGLRAEMAEEWEKAIEIYRNILRQEPGRMDLWLRVSDLEARLGNSKEAAAAFNEAVQLAPNDADEIRDRALMIESVSRPNIVIPILMYHCIGENTPNEYWVSRDEFEAQVKALAANGYQAVSTKDIYDYKYEGGELPPKPVIITFDDGCQELYTHAYPILMREGLFGEAFIITDTVGFSDADRRDSSPEGETGETGEPGETVITNFLIWPEIIEMASNGMIFGSHSEFHPDLTTLNDAQLQAELLHSKLEFYAYAGITVTSFAYPYGAGNDNAGIHQLLSKYGYKTAVGGGGGVEQTQFAQPLNLNRVYIYGPQPAADPESNGVSVQYDPGRPGDSFMGKVELTDAEICYRKSQGYSLANQPHLAFSAIERAVESEPDNIEYLGAYAQIANWVEKPKTAADAYERILFLSPEDDLTLLALARSYSWAGCLDRSVSAYKKYLAKHPEDKKVYIEYAKTESWRGNYVTSLNVLEDYRQRFGESEEYLQEKARVLAWARRPTRAMALISPLLEEEPDDYEVNYSRTVALHHDNRPEEAVESLEKLFQLRPDSKDTEFIERFVMAPIRSNVQLSSRFYTDSDDLARYHNSIKGVYKLEPETHLEVGAGTDYLDAKKGSGFESVDGDRDAWHHHAWVGVDHRFSPEVSVDGYVGVADAEGDTKPNGGVGINLYPQDNLNLRLESDYRFYLYSPRSVDLGIRRNRNHFLLEWEPDLLHTVIVDLGYDTFSDNNDRWEVILSPRRSLLRSGKFNLDCGFTTWWFGFDKDLDNGYYDPHLYQGYLVTGFGYWKISDDDGVSITADVGAVRDDDSDGFEFASGISAEATFGLYRDVMLKVGGSAYQSIRGDDEFNAYTAHIMLTIRF